MDLIKWKDDLEEIGERASKEFNIEMTLQTMMKNWEGVKFYLIPFKNSNTCTCTGFDDAMNLLDE
jgi:dynein heavy chain